jgi:DeoR family transcriptional regulator, aga operon transcriptional repressor
MDSMQHSRQDISDGTAEAAADDVRRWANFSPRRTERLAAVLDHLNVCGTAQVHDLASKMHVSEATMRRDLEILEGQNLLRRTHGGAKSKGLTAELPVRYRESHQHDAKIRIARACVELIPRRPLAIAIAGGTTTSEVARHLADRGELSIVTTAINIAMELAMWPRLRVIVAGGMVRSESYELVGAWTERFLEGLNFNMAIMGVDGISAGGGLTTHDAVEARSNEKMIERSQQVIIVADRTKIGTLTMSRIADVGRHQVLITEDGAPAKEIAALRAKGMEVRLV